MNKQLALIATVALVLTAGSAVAFERPSPSPLADKEVRLAGLDAEPSLARIAELDGGIAEDLENDLTVLGLDPRFAIVDARSGHWATLWLRRPLIPGDGVGNQLTWNQLGLSAEPGGEALGEAVWSQFVAFLTDRRQQLRIDPAELERRVGVASGGQLVQINGSRVIDGVPVRGAWVTATVNHGNLILLGTDRWGAIDVSTVPALSSNAAAARLEQHLAPFSPERYRDKPRLELLPVGTDGAVGDGWTHRLVWILRPDFDGLNHKYEAAVDAHTGELLSLQDTNHYATRNVKGGVYAITYDGAVPDGVEVAGTPMPFADISHGGGDVFADSGGNVFDIMGTMTTNLDGQFIRMSDGCGAINESSDDGDLDLGVSPDPDCDVPPGASPGNTHASRMGFYELNRLVEMARSHWPTPGPPANTWLNAQLTSNMNIPSTCNAFWNGSTVNFYREGGGCGNTGQIAAVFDHEWGHGIDDNGTNGSVSSPGEGIADIYAAVRLNTSCIGRGFRATPCGGYGDPCTVCTGVRDIDWALRASGMPHDVDWVNGNPNCGSVHCRGALYAEAFWDLLKRDLPTFYGMDNNTAQEIAARVGFLGADNVGTWFVLDNTGGGCAATSGYQQFLGADDDNGDLMDGTPHMAAIFSAFDRHQIACATPTNQDSGCAGAPTTAPVVTIGPNDTGADLSWPAVPDATRYKIFRTDGVFQCDFGKVIAGETTNTFFSDSGLQNGREYSYVVAAFGAEDTCMGPASACANVVPQAGLSAAASTVEICAGTDAAYTITVSPPFAPPVTMSIMGNPAPSTASFVPNPVVGPLPEDTVLTIGNTAGVAPGDHLMTATGDDTTITFNANLVLSVFNAVPTAPGLTAPADDAIDVALAPSYEWTASTQGDEYILEVDDDSGFGSIDYTATVNGTTHDQATPLDPETTYFWRVRTANVCGDGATSPTFSFVTRAIPPILLVDDDDNAPNTRALYEATLNTVVGLAGFDVWDTGNSDTEPSALDLEPYRVVIWFTGDEFGGACGPGAAGEAALATWLEEQNGCLFLSSQDYHFDRGLTAFMQNYLGVQSVTDDNGNYTSVNGVAGSIFEGLGPFPLNYGGAGVTDFSDTLFGNATSELLMEGTNFNDAALYKNAFIYQTFFLGFPWEVASESAREAMLNAVLESCVSGAADIFADGFEAGDTSAWSLTIGK
jgi:hypothetical protein